MGDSVTRYVLVLSLLRSSEELGVLNVSDNEIAAADNFCQFRPLR